MNRSSFTRRLFLRQAVRAGAAGVVMPSLIKGCSSERRAVVSPVFRDIAPEGRELRAGVIGCGSRGTGAATDFLAAASGVTITALGDLFEDRLNSCRNILNREYSQQIDDSNCFTGFDAWKGVLASDIDVVILATPPAFRPEHFSGAIDARKHVYLEKPVAVDPPGVRSVIATSRKAEGAGLSVVAGTIKRHQRDYAATQSMIAGGAIGDIVSANCYYNVGRLWHRKPEPQWSEMESMVRDWVNWCWLSGDHIVEQHIHSLDVLHWFMGGYPVAALGVGSRQRRVTGDQYDNFSVDFEMEGGVHYHSMCRQIDGCHNIVAEKMWGTKGYTNCVNTISDRDGNVKWNYSYPVDDEGRDTGRLPLSPFVQCHIDLISAIRTGVPLNEGEAVAMSTMVAIMGRISAYTGRRITMDEMMASGLQIGPERYELGPVDIPDVVPVPGNPAG